MTAEARKILSTPHCHVDEPTLRRLLAEAVARVDALEISLKRMTANFRTSLLLVNDKETRQLGMDIVNDARKLLES